MAYVYGNTVRKETVLPKVQEEIRPNQPEIVSERVRKNRRKAMHMNAGYVAFLTIATVITLVVCVKYLQLQSEITSRSKNIAAMQQELADLREDNTTKYNSILDSVNLEEVREKAMNEFGMVYAAPDQIVKYTSPTSNAVTQYENIPDSGVLAKSDKVKK